MDLMDYRRKIIMSSPHLSHAEGAVASFADGTDLPLKSLLVDIEPVQSGSGDPSPSNIRPISGWSAVGVHDTGINAWDEQWETGLISISNGQNDNGTGIRSKNMCPCAPNTTYYVKFGSGGSKYVFWYDKDGAFISYNNTTGSKTETSPANARFFRIRNDASTTYNHDISINYPSTDHDYHAYTGTSVTISLGQTVYGGTLNVLTGVLTVDRVGVDGGDVTWTKSSSYQYGKFSFLASDSLFNNLGYNVISSSYKAESNDGASTTGDMYVWVRSTHRIHVKDSGKDALTATEFQTAMTGQKFVYKLATPLTYTLDPQTVRSLVGQNNIFADTGNVALDYWAHP